MAISDRTFVLYGAMPIPVGHRVEVMLMLREVGVLGTDVERDEPVVHDLQTGIWYGRDWHFVPADDGTTARLPVPAKGTSVAEKMTGVVRSCVVSSQGVSAHQATQTTIVVAVDGMVRTG